MLGVTGPAGLRLALTMKSGLTPEVGSHLLVAIHAQSILRLSIELDVTLTAIIFPLGMPLNQFSRGNHRLNPLRPGGDR